MTNEHSDCIFCKIAAGEIPSDKVYENEFVYAFNDIVPKTPTHVLLIPKKHIASLHAATDEDRELLAELLRAATKIAEITGVDQSGYRVLTNIGSDGRQTVHHLHFHIHGGRKLGVDI